MQRDLLTLNECGKAVTEFFNQCFHGNFWDVFELRTTPFVFKSNMRLKHVKSLDARMNNLMDMIALKRALEHMKK